ncbi:glycosyltransferase [Flavobacterium sangjuense]|uniref:N-acetylgalactosamine-N, N'-diacetylbacillosaminyl-diphospho-undecaprenol 4-alpha-N-acetylgalactosaminyltransferase n=1 Tax=Flavobacterium sangjuense TaxID=2518177 RepID=A0A4P7PTE7_9FLAO|nr:glycosyltransferase [Flavobacterium sangjuense]QBZ98159.1 N-acetylgalactosamine-N,N'-diacetylbacillosaminyl-diphospho-undecaprenol 4-alpha-N-acetylgalactosaminyltransferase [Flavobacterium sangjuense]
MSKKRILFLGETYRADAITWMNGLKEFGDFEIVTWELHVSSTGINRIMRLFELANAILTIKSIVKKFNPDMVIAERTTSYGYLAAISGLKPVAIAQQGINDLWPYNSPLYIFKKRLQNYAFKKADLIHAWGNTMAEHMKESHVNMDKVMILPKGINLDFFQFNDASANTMINAVVTRALEPEYRHDLILKAFSIIKQREIPFKLTIIGDGTELRKLRLLATALKIENEVDFVGRVNNNAIPRYLQQANFYISTPITEGVSASLFEAMACGCFPIVSDLPGNRSWIQQKVNGILVSIENEFNLAQELEWAFLNNEFTKKAITQNRKFVEENANYKINMKKIALAYHNLINNKSTTL